MTWLVRAESWLERAEVQRWVALGCGAIAALAVLILTIHGPGLTPDASTYESAAISMRELKGAIASDGTPMVVFPPGYPALLMVVSLIGIGVRDAARLVGAGCMAVIVTWTLLFVLPRVRARLAAIALTGIGLGTAGSLLMFATWQLTDVLFATIVFAVAMLLGERPRRLWPWLYVLVIGLGAAAPLVRYIGVVVPVGVALAILVMVPGRPWVRLLRAVAALAVMMAPTAAWMSRNYALSGTLTGGRGTTGFPADTVLTSIGGSILHWVVPNREALPPPLPAVVGLAFPLVVAGLLLLSYRSAAVSPRLRPMLLFMLAYLAALWGSELLFAIDSVSARFMLPLFVPTVLLAVLAFDRLAGVLGRRGSPVLKPVLLGLVLVLLVPIGFDAARSAGSAILGGAGYYTPISRWTESPLIRDLQTRWPGSPVYSNENAPVYLYAHRYAREMPVYASTPESLDSQRWALRSAQEGALLVWLHTEPAPFPDVVVDGQRVRLETVGTYSDGRILRFVTGS